MRSCACLVPAALALLASNAAAGISWHHDVRAALEEAEARGVAVFIYLTRDD